MNIYSLPDIIGLIFNLSLVSNILGKPDKKRYSGYWLIAIILLFSIWILVDLISLNFVDKNTALIAAQITYRIIFLLPAFILSLSLKYQNRSKPVNPVIWLLIYAFPIIILALSFPHFNLNLIEFDKPAKLWYFALSLSPNPAFYAVLILSFTYIYLSIKIFRNLQKNIIGIYEKKYLQRLIFGLSSLFLFFLIIHFISSYLKTYAQLNFLKTSFLFLEIFIFYIIIRKFNVEEQKNNTKFSNFVIIAFILVLWFLLIQNTIKIIDDKFHIHTWYFDALQVMIFTLFLLPAAKYIQQIIRFKTNKKVLTYRKNFQHFSQELIDIIPLEEFLIKISIFIKDNFGSKNIFIFNLNDENGNLELLLENFELNIPQNDKSLKLINYKNINDFSGLFDKITNKDLKHFFIKQNIQLILPITEENKLIMFIALSDKADNKDYTQSEIDVLSIFLGEISLFIQRHRIFEKLQEKEREKFRLEKLAALGQLTAGIAHEIRNPLNTISSAGQTLMKKNLNAEQEQRMLKYINEEVERISGLMNDFLKLSKLKKPEYEDFKIEELIEKLKIFVSERNDKIKFNIQNSIKNTVKTDKKYLYQILINLISNATDAVEKKCSATDFTCSDGLIELKIDETDTNFIIKVEDNGTGIPTENKDKIFEPFFTSKENGTGLGLALITNMIKNLNGSISFIPSKVKTIFKIILPKNN